MRPRMLYSELEQMVPLQGYERNVTKCAKLLLKSRRIFDGTEAQFSKFCQVVWRTIAEKVQNFIHFEFSTLTDQSASAGAPTSVQLRLPV